MSNSKPFLVCTILSIATFSILLPARAQQGGDVSGTASITGKVVDQSKQPVAHAVVIICDQNSGVPLCKETLQPITKQWLAGQQTLDIACCTTDDQGQFVFQKIRPGKYRLLAQSWRDAESIKGLLEVNSQIIQLHGVAEHIEVLPASLSKVLISPLGTGVLQIDEEMPNDETLLIVSTAPTRADPILGFAGWSGAFMQNMIGGNRMPHGKTTIYGLPAGKVYVAMFAADSVPGWTQAQAQIKPDTVTVLDYVQFVNSWSNSRHYPPEELKPLVEELKSVPLPEDHPVNELYRQLQWESRGGQWHSIRAIIKYLDEAVELPSGRRVTFGQIAAGHRYIQLERYVKQRQEKRKTRSELIEQFTARHQARKEQRAKEQIDYSSAETFFPDDSEAGKELDVLLANRNSIFQSPPYGDWPDLIRRGLRRASIDKQQVLSALAYKYIQRQSPPDQLALDVIHYASFDPNLTHAAVYYGLSVAKPKSDKILKRLVELAMEYKELGRIAWGVKDQKQDFLELLEPYSKSTDGETREQAEVVKKVIDGEIDGYKWTKKWDLKRRQQKRNEEAANVRKEFGQQLPAIKQTLLNGDRESRLAELRRIEQHRLYLVLDESFFSAFQKCAEDKDSKVRKTTAVILGRHWIWAATPQSPEAIRIMMQLSRDNDPEVRHKAVYYGLSVITNKSDKVVKTLIDIAMNTKNYDTYERICWGLKSDKEATHRIVLDYLDDEIYNRQLLVDFYRYTFKEDLHKIADNR